MATVFSDLNVMTACFDENRAGGIMVCGINWGGDPNGEPSHESASFFSDEAVNNYPYRNRLLKWFNLWGEPLETKRGKEGAFERSIVQTNWLSDQTPTMHGRSIVEACVAKKSDFLFHLQTLRPRIILFCGSTLSKALNDPRCKAGAEGSLGVSTSLCWLQKHHRDADGKVCKRFRVGIQRFGQCDVVGLPHPTGCHGLSDDYIKEFRPEISRILQTFRKSIPCR